MKVVVFGASGFVGNAVCSELESRGHEVMRAKAPRFAPVAAVEIRDRLHGAHLDKASKELLEGADVVINAAGDPGATSGDEARFNSANALVPYAIAKDALACGVPRIIHISSSTVQGDYQPLDSSRNYRGFSPYSKSKILGERALQSLNSDKIVTYRPPAVHHESRRVTRMISKVARSSLSSVSSSAASGTPQALLDNVAAAAAFLAEYEGAVPTIVHHPWEGLTTRTLLEAMGDREPKTLPSALVRPAISAGKAAGKLVPWIAAQARRGELLWVGQDQAPSWLTGAGFVPPEGLSSWQKLGENSADPAGTQAPRTRVLIFTSHDVMIYNSRKEVVTELLDSGSEVLLAYPGGNRVQYFVDRGAQYQEISYDRHSKNPISDLKLLLAYMRVMRRFRPNVVLTYTIKPNIYGGIAANLMRIPFLANVTGVGSSFFEGGWLQRLVVGLYRFSLGRAAIVFFQNSENLKSFRDASIVDSNYRVLPGSGVNLEEFAYRDYPEDTDVTRLLYLGRIQRDKGIVELSRVARNLHDKGIPVVFEVAGFRDDGEIPEFESLVEAGVIVYHGNVPDVRPLIENSHAVVHPSHHEGMANVLLEGAAMGRPVLASDIPGCRETFDDGVTGLSFRAQSASSLMSTVQEFMQMTREERAEMGRRGREKVEQAFDRQVVIENYLRAISDALGPMTAVSSEDSAGLVQGESE